jgi:hypothetical protein
MKSKAIKALYVVPFAFLEALTVSFYQNVRKRLDGKSRKNHYMQIKVPKGYKDKKLEPEYKDLSANSNEGNMMNIFQ